MEEKQMEMEKARKVEEEKIRQEKLKLEEEVKRKQMVKFFPAKISKKNILK